MNDDTAGFAVDPALVRSAARELDAAAGQGQDALRALVAGLRALAATVPGSETAPAATALAAAWEAEGARWVGEARRLGEALAATASSGAAADGALAGLLARDAR
ncbi:MAG TPA: hypothetical protein VGH76_18300 [Actinomycetospora sp.]|jgi:hypothetical protein|uniref:hypothetical protein n=1 Tax=Actinomycetospora sp. TaxID=1872135 RepID=UPI002F42C701